MVYKSIQYTLKDGRKLVLRPPFESDAEEMLAFRIKSLGESDYLMQYPEEMAGYTIEKQLGFISRMIESNNDKLFVAVVDGKIAGTGQISFNTRIKTGHKAGIGIALLEEFWGLGIGSAIFTEIIKAATEREGVKLLQLEVIEGNDRAMALYKKFGFEAVAEIPDAVRLKDGSSHREIVMQKKL